MFKRIAVVAITCLFCASSLAESLPSGASVERQQEQQKPQSELGKRAREVLTEAAIVALIIAASVAAYKAMGKPCACPSDTMRNGRRCGGNSAWSRTGGYKPICFPTDVTAAMISTYRATNAIPGLK
jgi:hypothetical protein